MLKVSLKLPHTQKKKAGETQGFTNALYYLAKKITL